jgi:proteasome lid subunit RPN8/RPN11
VNIKDEHEDNNIIETKANETSRMMEMNIESSMRLSSATNGQFIPSAFRCKETRIHKPAERFFPDSYHQQGEQKQYSSWTYRVPIQQDALSGHFRIVILESILWRIFKHASEDMLYERYGILVGGVFSDPRSGEGWIEIVEMLPAEQVDASSVQVEISVTEIQKLDVRVDQMQTQTQGMLRKIGWYHTHPRHGIFMSSTDRDNQYLAYNADWQVALVIDPIQKLYGAFLGSECNAIDKGLIIISEAELVGLSEHLSSLKGKS